MAEYTFPRSREPQSRLPRLTLPGQSMNAPSGIEGFLKRLPPEMAAGTPAYQAGVDQSTGGEMRAAYGSMRAQEEAIRQQQEASLQAHKDYREKLQATQQQVNTRNNDLRLAQNLLIATDPSVDKSVRKFMLRGLSSASGVDPNGDYSKQLQQMVLGMQPEGLEAIRSAFGKDIREAPPGAIQQQLNGLFSGSVPIENVLGQVKQHQDAEATAAAAMTSPGVPLTTGANLSGAAPISGGPAEQLAEAGGATITPTPSLSDAPTAMPTQPVAAPQAPAEMAGIDPAAEAARMVQEAAAVPDDSGAVPVPEMPEAPVPPAAPTPTPEPTPVTAGLSDAPTATAAPGTIPEPVSAVPPAEVAAAAAAPPEVGRFEVPEKLREAAEKSGDKKTLDLIAKIDERNAILDSYKQANAPASTGPAGATPPPAGGLPGIAGAIVGAAKGIAGMAQTPEQKAAAAGTPTPEPLEKPKASATEKSGAYTIQPTGTEEPTGPTGPTAQQRLTAKVEAHNEKVSKVPPVDTSKLYPVEISKLPSGDQPLNPNAQAEVPHATEGIYTQNQVKQVSPGVPTGEAAQNKWATDLSDIRTFGTTVQRSASNINNIVAGNPSLVGGVSVNIPYIGQFDVTSGSWKTMKDAAGEYWRGTFGVNAETIQRYLGSVEAANDRLAERAGIKKDTREYAILYSELLGMSNAIARLQNPGRAPTDNDVKLAMQEVGKLTATGANLTATVSNLAQRYGLQADVQTSGLHKNPDVKTDLSKVPRNERDDMLAKDDALHGRTGTRTLSNDWRQRIQEANDKEDGKLPADPALKRAGVTIEQRQEVEQRAAGEEAGRKERTEQRSQETHQIALDRFKLEQQRYMDALAAKQQALAQAQSDKMAAAFARIGQMIAGSVRGGGVGGGSGISAGGEDASAFRITPAPQRGAPRVAPAPALTRYGGPIKKER